MFLQILWWLWKKIVEGSPPTQTPTQMLKKCISDVQFQGNGSEFKIISNDFWSSTIWAVQIQVSSREVKNPKIPEFSLTMLEIPNDVWRTDEGQPWSWVNWYWVYRYIYISYVYIHCIHHDNVICIILIVEYRFHVSLLYFTIILSFSTFSILIIKRIWKWEIAIARELRLF